MAAARADALFEPGICQRTRKREKDWWASMDLRQSHKRWLALQVRPRYEFIAATHLRSKGYEEFVPVYTVKSKWSDRTKKITAPLFRGYVFCKMDENIQFSLVTTPGVIRIVGTCGGAAYIEDSEIESIRMADKSGREVQPWTYWHVGDQVQIATGPLAGLQGVLVAYKNKHHLIISVNMIQSSMAVEVDPAGVQLIRPHKGTEGAVERVSV